MLYYPHGGGIKTYIDSKRLIYRKQNINHILIAPNFKNPGKLEKVQDGSLTTYYIPCLNITLFGTPYSIFSSFKPVAEIVEKEKVDVIEIGDKITTLLFKNKIKKLHQYGKVKIFGFSHERADNFAKTVIGDNVIGRFVSNLFIKRFVGAVDAILTNSDFTGSEILKHSPSDKFFVICLGINVADFTKDKYYDQKLYNQLSENGKKSLLVHVGRLDKDKKIDLLFDFAAALDADKYKLVIAGGGAYENKLKNLPTVELIGYIPHEEVKKYLAVCSLGILVNDIEPYGLVGLEMMAMGLLILGPNQGGLTTFLRPEFSWLLPHRKSDYLAAFEEWENLLEERKEKMSQAAVSQVQKYTLEKMVEQLLNVYQNHG